MENTEPEMDCQSNHIISSAKLFYPSAREWMWDYCIYLGSFTDSYGRNYDLGIHEKSAAIVFGNTPGDYSSGDLDYEFLIDHGRQPRECYAETIKRAELLGLYTKPKKI